MDVVLPPHDGDGVVEDVAAAAVVTRRFVVLSDSELRADLALKLGG